MRTTRFFMAVLVGSALAANGAAGQERADKFKAPDAAGQREPARVEVARNVRSSHIVGLPVKNKAGKDLGKIEDLVIDMKHGDVRYAALSFGGFAGFGGKLFAVPWQKMTFMLGENDRHFVFDVTPEQLERMHGFDSSKWPNVADPKWAAEIDKEHNFQRKDHPQATGKVEDKGGAPVAFDTVFRISKIKGMKVINDQNKDLGNVDELVIDVNAGRVKYAALSFGSTLGFGGKMFAVPLSEFTLKHATNDVFLVLHANEEALKNAPGFDKDHWPNTADPNWAAEIDRYYERTAKRPTTVK